MLPITRTPLWKCSSRACLSPTSSVRTVLIWKVSSAPSPRSARRAVKPWSALSTPRAPRPRVFAASCARTASWSASIWREPLFSVSMDWASPPPRSSAWESPSPGAEPSGVQPASAAVARTRKRPSEVLYFMVMLLERYLRPAGHSAADDSPRADSVPTPLPAISPRNRAQQFVRAPVIACAFADLPYFIGQAIAREDGGTATSAGATRRLVGRCCRSPRGRRTSGAPRGS